MRRYEDLTNMKKKKITYFLPQRHEDLTQIELIRKRPPLYTGSLNIEGIKTMLGYLFDEIPKNNSTRVEITIGCKKDNCISIAINDIDMTLFREDLLNLNVINTIRRNSALPVIVALSGDVRIKLQNQQTLIELSANKGIFEYTMSSVSDNLNKIEIDFKIDPEIFKNVEINYEVLNQFIRKYALINTDFRIISSDTTKDIEQINLFNYPTGLSAELDYKIGVEKYGNTMLRLDLTTKIKDFEYQICFAYKDSWVAQTYIVTYANYDDMIFGGSLEDGVIDGIIKAVKQWAKQNEQSTKIDYKIARQRLILIAVVKNRMGKFKFGGAIRGNLEMPNLRKRIKEYVSQELNTYFTENKTIADRLIEGYKK